MDNKVNSNIALRESVQSELNTKLTDLANAQTDLQIENINRQINELTKRRNELNSQIKVWLYSNYYNAQKSFFWTNSSVALSYWKTNDIKALTKKAIKDAWWAEEIILWWWDSIQNINLAKSLEDTWEYSIINKSSRWDFLNWWFDKEIHLSKIDSTDVNWNVINNEQLTDSIVERSLCNLWI